MELETEYIKAARQVLEQFGVEPIELVMGVPVSENITFAVVDARDGQKLLLRLHRPGYHSVAALRSEQLWTKALIGAGLGAPTWLSTSEGHALARMSAFSNSEARWASVAKWVDGEILERMVERASDVSVSRQYFGRLGEVMAKMHNQSVVWMPPQEFIRHSLDENGLMGTDPFWGRFWDHAMFSESEKELLLTARRKLYQALVRYGKNNRIYSLIHADLHPRNVVVGEMGTAVIDFDDCAFGWHQYDLAVALGKYRDHEHYESFASACIAGYRSARSISDDDLSILPMFFLIRDLVLVGWYHGRPEVTIPASLLDAKAAICEAADAYSPPF